MNVLVQGWNLTIYPTKGDIKNEEIVFCGEIAIYLEEENYKFFLENPPKCKFDLLVELGNGMLPWLKEPDQQTHPYFYRISFIHGSIMNELMTMQKSFKQLSSQKFFTLLKHFPNYSLMIIDQLRHQIVKTSTKWELFVTKMIVNNIVKKNGERNIDLLLLQMQKDNLVDQLQCKTTELSTIKTDFKKYKDSTEKEISQLNKNITRNNRDTVILEQLLQTQREEIGRLKDELQQLKAEKYSKMTKDYQKNIDKMRKETKELKEKFSEMEQLWTSATERAEDLQEKLEKTRRTMTERMFAQGKEMLELKRNLKTSAPNIILRINELPMIEPECNDLKMIIRISQLKFCYILGRRLERRFSLTMFEKSPEMELNIHPLFGRMMQILSKKEEKSEKLETFMKEYGVVKNLGVLLGDIFMEEYLTGAFYYSWFCFNCEQFKEYNYLPYFFKFFWKLQPNYQKIIETMNQQQPTLEKLNDCFVFYNKLFFYLM